MSTDIKKSDTKARIVRCPTCGGDSQFDSSNASRPFCSPRCKNVDLGAWANEEFRVESKDVEGNGDSTDSSLAID